MPGVGPTIRLIFPRASKVIEAVAIAIPSKRTPKRVLLVEDHPDSREFMQALLESDGHSVDVAEGVEQATVMLDTPVREYDVLVSDIGLGDGSGWDLIATARLKWPDLRIGVVTGWEPPAGLSEAGFIFPNTLRTTHLFPNVAP